MVLRIPSVLTIEYFRKKTKQTKANVSMGESRKACFVLLRFKLESVFIPSHSQDLRVRSNGRLVRATGTDVGVGATVWRENPRSCLRRRSEHFGGAAS